MIKAYKELTDDKDLFNDDLGTRVRFTIFEWDSFKVIEVGSKFLLSDKLRDD